MIKEHMLKIYFLLLPIEKTENMIKIIIDKQLRYTGIKHYNILFLIYLNLIWLLMVHFVKGISHIFNCLIT